METCEISGGESTPSTQPRLAVSTGVPSKEELDKLLEHFPTFIGMEPLVSNMTNNSNSF